jgi:hypothetical protein
LKKPILLILAVIILLLQEGIVYGGAEEGSSSPYVRVKAAIIHDGTLSSLQVMDEVSHLLLINSIPFDPIDVAGGGLTLTDGEGNLLYSSIILTTGNLEQPILSSVKDALDSGIGLVVVGSEIIGDPGIWDILFPTSPGDKSQRLLEAKDLVIRDEAFLIGFSEGDILPIQLKTMNYSFTDVRILATAEHPSTGQEIPIIVEGDAGNGLVILFNIEPPLPSLLYGLLVQGILHSMPLGFASPRAVGIIQVDDAPRPLYSEDEINQYFFWWQKSFDRFLKRYGFNATYYLIFSYSESLYDFWVNYPESEEWIKEVIQGGYELGLHGGNHYSLTLDPHRAWQHFTGEKELRNYVKRVMDQWALLNRTMSLRAGVSFCWPTSYVAPMNVLDEYGYKALQDLSTIKYVSTLTLWEYEFASGSGFLNETLREAGWEDGLEDKIFNIPRTQGGFLPFLTGTSRNRLWTHAILKNRVEAGDLYAIFTHPDEIMILGNSRSGMGSEYKGETINATMEGYEMALTYFGDLVTEGYPHLRWWSTKETGEYLIEKAGMKMDARYYPSKGILEVWVSGAPKGVIFQVKGKDSLALKEASFQEGRLILTLGEGLENPILEDGLQTVQVRNNLFISQRPEEKAVQITIQEPRSILEPFLYSLSIFITLLSIGILLMRRL